MKVNILILICLISVGNIYARNNILHIPINKITKVDIYFYDFDIYTSVIFPCESFEQMASIKSKTFDNLVDITKLMDNLSLLELDENNIKNKIKISYPDGSKSRLSINANHTTIEWDGIKYNITPKFTHYINNVTQKSPLKIVLKRKADVDEFNSIIHEMEPIADLIDVRAKINIYTKAKVISLCIGEFNMKVIGKKDKLKLREDFKKYIYDLFK